MKKGEGKKAEEPKVPQRSAGGRLFAGDVGRGLRTGEAPPRLPGESEAEYSYFLAFWRKGAAMSARAIARELGQTQGHLSRVRKKRHWDARVQGALEEPEDLKRGWLERRDGLRQEEWRLYRECLAAGREALRKWQELGSKAGLGEIVKLLEFAARLARLAAGMPEGQIEVTGEGGEPIRLQFEAALAQAYGPVVDVVAEVVEKAEERARDDNDTGKITELRTAVAAVEGSQRGGPALRGAPAGAVRPPAGERPDGGAVREGEGAGGTEEEPGV